MYTPTKKLWTIEEYYKFIELGVFKQQERLELIQGELISISPKGLRHELILQRLLREIFRLIGNSAIVRCQSPIYIPPRSAPEPDLIILRSREDEYATTQPQANDVILLIEVSDSTLTYDRTTKLQLYAQASISNYWIFNLTDNWLETYNEPDRGEYLNRRIIRGDRTVTLLEDLELNLNKIL
jgi:Uma2 family endonuclease